MNKKKFLGANVRDLKRCSMLYLLLLPSVVAVFIFHYIPIYGLQIAFKDYKVSLGVWDSKWIGFENFVDFFQYPYFGKIIKNTIWISLRSLLNFPFPIVFAIMLHEMRTPHLKKICQQITYSPHFVSTVVVCSMITLFTNRETGLINMIIKYFGGETVDFMGNPNMFADIYAISGLWQGLGWSTIIYLSALSGVSLELVEAAKIDGASRIKVIWYIYIPHLLPTIVTLFILNLGSLMSVGFEKTFLLQNPLNRDASSIVATYVYEMGMTQVDYSYSTAIGLFNSIVNIIFVTTANFISKLTTKVSLW